MNYSLAKPTGGNRQQAGLLTDIDRSELQILMQTYQEGLLRKATALSEAVKRKLIKHQVDLYD